MNCKRCNYNWQSRIKAPKACPRCKTRFDYPKEAKWLIGKN